MLDDTHVMNLDLVRGQDEVKLVAGDRCGFRSDGFLCVSVVFVSQHLGRWKIFDWDCDDDDILVWIQKLTYQQSFSDGSTHYVRP